MANNITEYPAPLNPMELFQSARNQEESEPAIVFIPWTLHAVGQAGMGQSVDSRTVKMIRPVFRPTSVQRYDQSKVIGRNQWVSKLTARIIIF